MGMETLLLNLYQPPSGDTRTTRPAIVCIHGGGFSQGDRNKVEFVKWAKHFASRGFVAVSIDYRLEANRPPHRGNMSTANLDAMYDAKAAVRWLQKNRAEYRVDPNRIAAFGGSAGAMTVAYLTAVPGEGNSGNSGYPSNITAGVSLSGILQPQEWGYINASDPPYIDFHGSADPLIPIKEAQATKAAMDKAGAVNALVTLPGQKHVPFPALQNHIEDVMGFLSKYLKLACAQCPSVLTSQTDMVTV